MAETIKASTEVHSGQLRIAYRLAASHDGELLHVHGIGWHHWDGSRFVADESGHARRAVFAVLRASRLDAARLDTEDQRKRLWSDVQRCESAAGVDGVLKLASAMPEFACAVGELDADPWLLNTPTGTLDLRTMVLRACSPRDRLTKATATGYDPKATAPTWEKFLTEALPDEAVREHLRRLVGSSLVGKVAEHVLPIFTGTGRNGKGVLTRTIGAMLADYAIEAEPDLIMARDNAHPTGQLDLRGVRFATVQESDEGRRLAVATVKRLTGGDTIRARRMGKDFVEFKPSHQAVLITNHLPKVPGDDPALWARLMLVPFTVSFLGREDEGLEDRLALELPGILAWAVQGYEDYREQGLNPPPAVLAATKGYRLDSDTVGAFLDARCVIGSGYSAQSGLLWSEWTNHCRAAGEDPGDQKALKKAIESRGHDYKRTGAGIFIQGLGIRQKEEAS